MFESENNVFFQAISQFMGSGRPVALQSQCEDRTDLATPALILDPAKSAAADLVRQGYDRQRCFAVLPSRHTPRWLLPLGDRHRTLVGTQIYTPYARTARIMKSLLSGIVRTGWSGWAHQRVAIASRGPLPIESLVSDITGEPSPIFALSLGTQLAVRKLTVQVMRPDGDILGYMKLPLTGVANERVRQEARALEQLWEFTAVRPHIPRLLHAGPWDNSWILFQSPLPGRPGAASFSGVHEKFLEILGSIHHLEKPGYRLVDEIRAKWEKAAPILGGKWPGLGQEVLRRSAQALDRAMIPCGVVHGDFAPWNTRVQQETLLVFDWESMDWDGPREWDIFHFHVQTATSLRKGIRRTLHSEDKFSHGTLYLLYLLSSVVQFLEEENWAAIALRQELLVSELQRTVSVQSHKRAGEKPVVRITDREPASHLPAPVSELKRMPTIVTTSWDDGDPRDLKVAALLHRRGLSGTFYIPMSGYLGGATLVPTDLRALSSAGFEIGAHSVSHNTLTHITGERLEYEVRTCKQTLEQHIGREVPMFCYPNGRYSPVVLREVKRAGYKGARTTRTLTRTLQFGAFEMPTTLHAHPHARSAHFRNLGRARNIGGLCEYVVRFSRIDSWVTLGNTLFDLVLQRGGMWHLYGHSWEIEALGIWRQLEAMLDYISNRPGVVYATNYELVQRLNAPSRMDAVPDSVGATAGSHTGP